MLSQRAQSEHPLSASPRQRHHFAARKKGNVGAQLSGNRKKPSLADRVPRERIQQTKNSARIGTGEPDLLMVGTRIALR